MRTFLSALLFTAACGASPSSSKPAPQHIPLIGANWDIDEAASEAAAYLVRHLDSNGRFDYVRQTTVSEKKYNILRHAGSIHSLVQYNQNRPSEEVNSAIVRAARYLKERYVQPLPKHPALFAAVSRPGEENLSAPTARLGGTALAVIALRGAMALDPSVISVADLQAMGKFLLFMQKDDGGFHSKYLVGDDFDLSFHSLYYPGETMLALTMLYDVDGDQKWLDAALRSAAELVQGRQGEEDWPADHWMMLSSLPLLERYESVEAPAISAEDLRTHIAVMGTKIMKDQREGGFFAKQPKSTPTATRLEGLSALARIQGTIGEVDPTLQESIDRGLEFLMRCQLKEAGAHRGGMPRSCATDAQDERRGEEIRIDYVQHYLSALLTAPHSTSGD